MRDSKRKSAKLSFYNAQEAASSDNEQEGHKHSTADSASSNGNAENDANFAEQNESVEDIQAFETRFDPQPSTAFETFAADRNRLEELKDRHQFLGLTSETSFFMTVSVTVPIGSSLQDHRVAVQKWDVIQTTPDRSIELEDDCIKWRSIDGRSGASGRVPHDSKISADARRKFGQYTDEALVSHLEAGAEAHIENHLPTQTARNTDAESFFGVTIDPGTNFSCHGRAQRIMCRMMRWDCPWQLNWSRDGIAYEARVGFKASHRQRSSGNIRSLGAASEVVGLVDLSFPIDGKSSFANFVSREKTSDAPFFLGKHDLLFLGFKLDIDRYRCRRQRTARPKRNYTACLAERTSLRQLNI